MLPHLCVCDGLCMPHLELPSLRDDSLMYLPMRVQCPQSVMCPRQSKIFRLYCHSRAFLDYCGHLHAENGILVDAGHLEVQSGCQVQQPWQLLQRKSVLLCQRPLRCLPVARQSPRYPQLLLHCSRCHVAAASALMHWTGVRDLRWRGCLRTQMQLP